MTNENKGYLSFMNEVREEIVRQTADISYLEPQLVCINDTVTVQEVRVEILNIGERRSTQQLAVVLHRLFGLPPYEARRVVADLITGGERTRQLVYKGCYRVAREKVHLAKTMLGDTYRCEFLIEEE